MATSPVNNGSLPESIGKPSSVLTDTDIRHALNLKQNYLLKNDTYSDVCIRHASYELRVGSKFKILRFTSEGPTHVLGEVPSDKIIKINPGETVLLYTKEILMIPANVLGRITTLGQVFSSGLAAENTFADPGFKGSLYITVSNISSKIIGIKVEDPLARIEFYRLGAPVHESYEDHEPRKPYLEAYSVPKEDWNKFDKAKLRELIEQIKKFSESETYDRRHDKSAFILGTLCDQIAEHSSTSNEKIERVSNELNTIVASSNEKIERVSNELNTIVASSIDEATTALDSKIITGVEQLERRLVNLKVAIYVLYPSVFVIALILAWRPVKSLVPQIVSDEVVKLVIGGIGIAIGGLLLWFWKDLWATLKAFFKNLAGRSK